MQSVVYSKCGSKLVRAEGKDIVVCDAVTGFVESTLTGHSGSVLSVAFSKDGTRLVSGSSDGTVKIWSAGSAGTFECESTLSGHDGWVLSVCFSPDGKQIASGSKDNTMRIWDAATGAAVGSPRRWECLKLGFLAMRLQDRCCMQ